MSLARAPITTLPEAIEQLMDWAKFEANWSPHATRAYHGRLHLFVTWLRRQGYSLQLTSLTAAVGRAYVRQLGASGLSDGTRSAYIIPLRRLIRFLHDEGLIPEDFSHRLVLPKLTKNLPKPITADDLPLLLNLPDGSIEPPLVAGKRRPAEWALQQRRDRALVLFLLSTGCRISEALALDRAAVPTQGDSMYVIGKGNKERLVRLIPDAKQAVHAYLQLRTDRHPALFLHYARGSNAKGLDDRLTAAGAVHIMGRLRRRYKIWSLTSPHVLRHTAATLLLEVTGGNAILVAEVLGHADLRTVTTYARVMEGRFADAYAAYGTRLSGGQIEELA